jgi:hypothetical protein
MNKLFDSYKQHAAAVHLVLFFIAAFVVTGLIGQSHRVKAASPTITIEVPTDGGTVGDIQNLQATVSGGTITAASFQVIFNNNTFSQGLASSGDGGTTWTDSMDVSSLPNDTPLQIYVLALLPDTSTIQSQTINVTVSNGGGGGGGGGPTVTITSPEDGSSISGNAVPFSITLSEGTMDSGYVILGEGRDAPSFNISDDGRGNLSAIVDATDPFFVPGESYPAVAHIFSNEQELVSNAVTVTISAAPTLVMDFQGDRENATALPSGGVTFRAETVGFVADSVQFIIEGQEPVAGIPVVRSNDWNAALTAPATVGTYQVIAVATVDEATITSNAITLTVLEALPRTVSLTYTPNNYYGASGGFAASVQGHDQPDSVTFIVNNGALSIPMTKTTNCESEFVCEWFVRTNLIEPWVIGENTVKAHAVYADEEEIDSDVSTLTIFRSAPRSVSVASVSMTAPSNGSVVSGDTPLKLSVSPNAVSAFFEIYKNNQGVPEKLDAASQDGMWQADWHTSTEENGNYTIRGSAVMEQGNVFSSNPLMVTVSNQETDQTSTSTSDVATSTQLTTTTKDLDQKTTSTKVLLETATSTYIASTVVEKNPTIDVALGLTPVIGPVFCAPGSLVKTKSLTAIYYCGADGKRYAFPNDRVFFSWYEDFSKVLTIDTDLLSHLPLGGNVSYRPGKRMVKITTDPKVYAVDRGPILRWITSEDVAKKLFGPNWNTFVDDVSDAYFVNYRVGEPIK